MQENVKHVSQLLILGVVITLGYLSFNHEYIYSLWAILLFFILSLAHYVRFNIHANTVFKKVIVVFIFSILFSLGFSYAKNDTVGFIHISQLFGTLGFFLILQELFKEIDIRFTFNIYTLLSVSVILANMLLIYHLVAIINKFNLGLSHTAFVFIFTIINTLILSLGLVGYFFSIWKSKRVTLLFMAIALFLIGDLFDSLNYLFFMDNLIYEGLFLQYMSSLIGVYFFYRYCIYPKEEYVV